jgi:hypothetical protein
MKIYMHFSPPSCHLIPISSKYSPKYPVLKRLHAAFSFIVTDQFLTRTENNGKIITFYILIFTFLDSRQKDKLVWTKRW